MTPEQEHKLMAQVVAQRFLIRELLLMTFGSKPGAISQYDDYTRQVLARFDASSIPGVDAAISDMLSDEVASALRSVLQETRANLVKLLKRPPR